MFCFSERVDNESVRKKNLTQWCAERSRAVLTEDSIEKFLVPLNTAAQKGGM